MTFNYPYTLLFPHPTLHIMCTHTDTFQLTTSTNHVLTFYSLYELISDVLDLKEGVGIVVVVSLRGKRYITITTQYKQTTFNILHMGFVH